MIYAPPANAWDYVNLENRCHAEIEQYCQTETQASGDDRAKKSIVLDCLRKHTDDLSNGCKVELKDGPLAEMPRLSPKAVPGFAALGGLGLIPASVPTVNYGGSFTPQQQSGDVVQNHLTIQTPIYQDDKNLFSLSAGATSLHFGQEQTLDTSGIPVPIDLWKIDFGGGYSRKIDDDKLIGGRLSIGSASDHPFADFDVTTIGASAYYSWASTEHSRWMLTILFSNNNPIINYVPIPGFIYMYETPTFIGMFGFPYSSMVWKPSDPWMYTLSIFGPTINAEIAYGNPKNAQIYTGFNWIQQSYLPENRPETNDRLYYDEKHLPLGVRFPVTKGLFSDLSVGYAFDRSAYEGEHFLSKNEGSATLASSWYGAWNLRLVL